GVYTVQAIATDLVGNSFAGTAISFTLDNTTPSPINIGTTDSEDSLVTTRVVSATVPLGETVFVTVAMDPSSSNVSVTDSAGNTYIKDADKTNGSGDDGVRTLIFRSSITTALAGGTITINFPSPTPQNKTVSIFSFNNVGALDRLHTATGFTNAPDSGLTTTTSFPNELLIVALGVQDKNVQWASVETGFTLLPDWTAYAHNTDM